jgi:hypothetical protein
MLRELTARGADRLVDPSAIIEPGPHVVRRADGVDVGSGRDGPAAFHDSIAGRHRVGIAGGDADDDPDRRTVSRDDAAPDGSTDPTAHVTADATPDRPTDGPAHAATDSAAVTSADRDAEPAEPVDHARRPLRQ